MGVIGYDCIDMYVSVFFCSSPEEKCSLRQNILEQYWYIAFYWLAKYRIPAINCSVSSF